MIIYDCFDQVKRLNRIYIYHHLGLGDHILCNGLVRKYFRSFCIEKDYQLTVAVKANNESNVKRMFGDLDKLNFCIVPNNANELVYVNHEVEKSANNVLIRIGFSDLEIQKILNPHLSFDQHFYYLAGIGHNERWNSFHLPRDVVLEQKVLNRYNPLNNDYIFVHEDPSRGIYLNVDTHKKIIFNPSDVPLFELCSLLENASELHLMESSIKCLVDHLSPKGKLFYYKNARQNDFGDILSASSRFTWEII